MAVTIGPRFGLTRWSSALDPFRRSQMDASHAALEQYAMRAESVPTVADRPAAGIVDRIVTAEDTGVMYRDTGTAWHVVGAATAGLTVSRATTGQTGRLAEWRNALGDLLASITVGGRVTATGVDAASTDVNVTPLTAKGPAGNLARLLTLARDTIVVAAFDNFGRLFVPHVQVDGVDTNRALLDLRAPSGMLAPLTYWRGASGDTVASVGKDGAITAPRIAAGEHVYADGEHVYHAGPWVRPPAAGEYKFTPASGWSLDLDLSYYREISAGDNRYAELFLVCTTTATATPDTAGVIAGFGVIATVPTPLIPVRDAGLTKVGRRLASAAINNSGQILAEAWVGTLAVPSGHRIFITGVYPIN